MVISYVPRETDSRLELFLLAVKSPIRWEKRVAQKYGVGGLAWWCNYARKNLRFPAKPITQTQVGQNLPFVLRKECVVLVVDAGGSGLNVDQSGRHATLEVKDQRTAHAAAGGTCFSLVLRNPARKCSRDIINTLADGRTKASRSIGRCIAQKANHAVEDVTSGEESTEYLGVVGVQPVTTKLEIMLSMDDGEIVAKLRAPNRLIDVWVEKERIPEAEVRGLR